MRVYDIQIVDEHICATDPSQKVLDSWVRIKKDAAEASKPSHNVRDYAAALRVLHEYRALPTTSGVSTLFDSWVRQRLNSAKAPNCA
jgi:hypothetical protein